MPPVDASPPATRVVPGLDDAFAVRLAPAKGAASAARDVVKQRFGDLLAQETMDDALLVVSELVTNAVLHGEGQIELRMHFDGQRVTGDVTDEGTHFMPPQRAHAAGQIGGHGVYLVGRIANSWGRREGSSHVWFEILGPGPERPEAGSRLS